MKAIYAVPGTLLLVYRAWSRKSLTPIGIFAAVLTAIAHAVHPWSLPFVLLAVFFLASSRATHVKQNVKAQLTVGAQGTPGGEGARTHVQVLANSSVASVLCLIQAYQFYRSQATQQQPQCFAWGSTESLAAVGIVANYACVAADTFSSELGILSRGEPRLITSPTLRRVPRGTNGGVSALGLGAGLLGSVIIVAAAVPLLPFCANGWTWQRRAGFALAMAAWGVGGSLLDSILGGLFQRSVKDVRSGKIVEGEGGVRVLVSEHQADHHTTEKATTAHTSSSSAVVDDEDTKGSSPARNRYDPHNKHRRSSFGNEKPSRVVESGWNLLDNNDVNFLMAFIMSVGAMTIASWYWGVPLQSLVSFIGSA